MDQKSLDLVVLAECDALVAGVLEVDGVRHLAVCAAHIVKVVINESESVGIDGGDHVDASALESCGCHAKPRPACDTFEHDPVLFLCAECADAFLVVLLVLLIQLFHSFRRFQFAAGGNHNCHVVEQIEAVER